MGFLDKTLRDCIPFDFITSSSVRGNTADISVLELRIRELEKIVIMLTEEKTKTKS